MNLRLLEFPRHVHQLEEGQIVRSRVVADLPACEAALAEGFIVIPPAGFVDDEPVAPAVVPPDPPKRKPGRPPKQQEG